MGLRVNPQVGQGAIQATSTATSTSKFGVTLNENREQIIEAVTTNPWLNGLHVHVGSQGCPLQLIVGRAVLHLHYSYIRWRKTDCGTC